MVVRQITTEQLEKVKKLAEDFRKDDRRFVYRGTMPLIDYCLLLGIDYITVRLLGEIRYTISYAGAEDKDYRLYCETYIDGCMNEKLSFVLEDMVEDSVMAGDFLGLFTKEREKKIGVAQRLPDNWKELMSDEQKKEIAEEWCKNNSVELEQYLDDYDKEKIAYDYIDENPDEVASKAFDKLSDPKDFIKDCIDEL